MISNFLPHAHLENNWLLNIGSGVCELQIKGWKTVSVDIFPTPIQRHCFPVCASVEKLPFANASFAAVLCVGEVLAYCDPAKALRECARVVAPSGRIMCDFRSSRSLRYWFTKTYSRTADLIEDQYNGTPEPTWVYDPGYIRNILTSHRLTIRNVLGTHTWSALARRMGCSPTSSVGFEAALSHLTLPAQLADLITVVADRL